MARLGKFFYINGTDNLSNAHFLRVRADGGITESLGCIDTAGTLLESASYFMRPSGYKEDTVYSLIPNNSNGSLNFVRASDAWRTEIGGLIQRTPYNLAVYSEQFENANWNKYQSTINTNATVDPNGNLTADKIVSSATTSEHYVLQNINATGGTVYSTSVYLKAGEYTWAKVASNISGSAVGAFFNLSTGVVGTIDSGVTASIQNIGNGWYRCTITSTAGTSGLKYFVIWPTNSGSAIVYTGDGTSGIFAYGFQVVEGADQLPYFPTTDRLNVPRLSYMYGSCPALLLEPQRTNSLRNSTMVGASTSPSTLPTNWTSFTTYGLTVAIAGVGTENGVNYIDISYTGTATTSDAVRIGFEQSLQISASNGQSWSLSTYAKIISQSAPPSSYDLRMTERALVGGGVVTLGTQSITPTSTLTRFTYTRTLSGGATVGYVAPEFSVPVINGTSYNFTIRIAQPQMELGAYATTPILTTGSASATRIADSFSRNNIYTNGLITSSGGTWFVELRGNIAYTRDSSTRFGIGDTTALTTNSLFFIGDIGNRINLWKSISGSVTGLYTTTTDTTKFAFKWNGTSCDIFANGTKVVSATSFTTTNMENLIGALGVPIFIQSMALFNYPLGDSDCQLLTT
jgi:hypothetical protein